MPRTIIYSTPPRENSLGNRWRRWRKRNEQPSQPALHIIVPVLPEFLDKRPRSLTQRQKIAHHLGMLAYHEAARLVRERIPFTPTPNEKFAEVAPARPEGFRDGKVDLAVVVDVLEQAFHPQNPTDRHPADVIEHHFKLDSFRNE